MGLPPPPMGGPMAMMGGPMAMMGAGQLVPPPAPPLGKPPAPGDKGKDDKKKGKVREAAGVRWRDSTLDEWPENDFRVRRAPLISFGRGAPLPLSLQSGSRGRQRRRAGGVPMPPPALFHPRSHTPFPPAAPSPAPPLPAQLFVGNLGNEVNDDVLTRAFQHFPSFAKAKVIKNKQTNKK